MKKTLYVALLALAALGLCTLAGEKASAQTAMTAQYSAMNGPGFVRILTNVVGMDTTKIGHRLVLISNNASMLPIIGSKSVNFTGNGLKTDSVNVSVMYPQYFYVRVLVTDTFGSVVDTAQAVPFMVTYVTPPFIAATDTLSAPSSTVQTASFASVFTSGYDTAHVKVIVSYGDTTFSAPSWNYPADSQTVLPVIGQTDQRQFLVTNLSIGAFNYYYSYKVIFWNSIHRDTSRRFWGKTLAVPGSGTCSTPYNVVVSKDTIKSDAQVNTGDSSCVYKTYIASSLAGNAIDSFVVSLPGSVNLNTVHSVLHGTPGANYWIWNSVKNSLMTIPFITNRAHVYVPPLPDTFKIFIDSTKRSGQDEKVYVRINMPANDTAAHLTFLLALQNDSIHILQMNPLQVVIAGVTPFTVTATNLSVGGKYMVTVYGADDSRFTHLYFPWEVQKKFTFGVTTTFVYDELPPAPSMYPNPAKNAIVVSYSLWKNHTYRICDMGGRLVLTAKAVSEKTTISLGDLPSGIYLLDGQKIVVEK